MFKRLFWLLTGILAGVTMAVYVQRAVRRSVRRLQPDRLTDDVISAFRDFGTDLRKAIAEGRDAMHAREAELRATLDGSLGGQP